MEIDPQLNLFEPVYLLKESALRKLRTFDLDGAQEDLNRIEVTEPKNPFATASLAAITNFRKRLYKALGVKSPLGQALALHEAWAEFQSEAGTQFSVDSIILNSMRAGVWQKITEVLETVPGEEVIALYPRLSLGHLKLEAGDYQGASEALKKLLASHGQDPTLLTALANAHYHLGQYPDADECYLKAFFADTEAAFREGVENKVLTLSFESFLAEEMELCWFPVYAVLKGAAKISRSLLHSVPWADALSAAASEPSSPTRMPDNRDSARLFYILMVSAEGAPTDKWDELITLRRRMKKLNPAAFEWYLDYKKS